MAKPSSRERMHPFPRVLANLSGTALRGNFRTIASLVDARVGVLPMIKADAYGHGAQWAAKQLLKLRSARLRGFGVASLEEGAALRQGSVRARTRLVCFSGGAPWSEEKRRFCVRYDLIPVFSTEEDWRRFSRKGGGVGQLAYELKFDTGMHRLGLSMDSLEAIARNLSRRPLNERPAGVMSHLAISETPSALLTRKQVERFAEIRARLSGVCPDACFHLANSGGIWNFDKLGLAELTGGVRPGLSLYGVPPWPGAPSEGLQPVMRVSARIIAIKRLEPRDTVGYGATYAVPGPRPAQIAILSGGYADGIKRSLSNGGQARLAASKTGQASLAVGNRALSFLGIVSMDLCAVGILPEKGGNRAAVGQWVDILGGEIDPWQQARAAGTIPYELLTSWSARVERIYHD